MIRLASTFEIISGHAFRGGLSNLSSGNQCLIRPSNLDDLDEDRLGKYQLDAPAIRLNRHDVLLSNKGKFRAALVNRTGDYVIPSSIFVLRSRNNDIHTPYLVAFLNSRSGQAALGQIALGSNIPALTKSTLEDLRVPELARDTQLRVATMATQIAGYRRLTDEKIDAMEVVINQLMKERE